MTDITVEVRVAGERKRQKIRLKRGKLLDLLKELNFNPQTVVARVNGKIVVEHERLADGDFVEIVPIVTGG